MAVLVFLGGPPGVGKSTVAPLVAKRLARRAWVDADDLWRIFPWEVTDDTRAIVEANIQSVLRVFLQSRFDHVLLTWVLHREDLIDRLLGPLGSMCDSTHVIHLVSDEATLRERIAQQPERGRSLERALERLSQIRALRFPKVDTHGLQPDLVAERIARIVRTR